MLSPTLSLKNEITERKQAVAAIIQREARNKNKKETEAEKARRLIMEELQRTTKVPPIYSH